MHKSFLCQIFRLPCIRTVISTVSQHIRVILPDKSVKSICISLPHLSDQEKICIYMILLSGFVKFKTFIPSVMYNN